MKGLKGYAGWGIAGILSACSLSTPAVAQVEFRLGEAVAPPGTARVSLPVSILIGPGASPVYGWSAVWSYDPSVVTAVSIESTRQAIACRLHAPAEFSEAGMVGVSVAYGEGDSGQAIWPHSSGVVANLLLCVRSTASPGEYPLEFLGEGNLNSSGTLETEYSSEAGDLAPVVEGGVLMVAGPRVREECDLDGHEGTPPVPRPTATFELNDASASPGEEIDLHLAITTNVEAAGFGFSIDFDEGSLVAMDVEQLFRRPGGGDPDYSVIEINNLDERPGENRIEEGFARGALIFDFSDPMVHLAVDGRNDVLALRMLVKETAGAGPTDVRFADPPEGTSGLLLRNSLVLFGSIVRPTVQNPWTFVHSRVSIVGDVTAFARGDSNDDGKVDVGDAQFTLSYLYLGGAEPRCLDAADSNDDGAIDITDPVAIIRMLFLGGGSLPDPGDDPGVDPTRDDLGCALP